MKKYKKPFIEISIIFILLSTILFLTPLYVWHYNAATVAFGVADDSSGIDNLYAENATFINERPKIEVYGNQRFTTKTGKS
jgi:hypothetical protein